MPSRSLGAPRVGFPVIGVMENQQAWRMRFSYRNATILVCFFNLVTALFLLHGFFTAASSRGARGNPIDPAKLRYIMESEEMRRAMEPLELIKRVREIEQDSYIEPETEQHITPKRTAAVDLSKRLKDFRSMNDANSLKALEDWRKRKIERERQREIEKNVTTASQT